LHFFFFYHYAVYLILRIFTIFAPFLSYFFVIFSGCFIVLCNT